VTPGEGQQRELDGVQRGEDAALQSTERAEAEMTQRTLQIAHVVLADGQVVREVSPARRVIRMKVTELGTQLGFLPQRAVAKLAERLEQLFDCGSVHCVRTVMTSSSQAHRLYESMTTP